MLRLSELSSAEHREQADKWRTRIRIVALITFSMVMCIMLRDIVTRSVHSTALIVAVFWIGVLAIGLMFIPLVRHNRKDDQFT